MSPIILAALVGAALLAVLPCVAGKTTHAQKTQYSIETDEDLLVIADVYRDQRKSERAQIALERLSKITPSPAKK